ncbi:MAG: GNAT family N-acetyltransferase [Aggregatilineales bacterium]
MIEYRDLQNIAEMRDLIELEIRAWQLTDRDAVPLHMMMAIQHSGGSIIGAFDTENDDTLIGFSLAFPTKDRELLWSHMAAVDPTVQGQNIGFWLKQAQRKWALENGYTKIGWTYDPMARRNARFNLHKLAVQVTDYHENFYGEMTDGLNAGLPSDRFEVYWHLNNTRVIKNAAGDIVDQQYDLTTSNILLAHEADSLRYNNPESWSQPFYAIEIPYDASDMKMHHLSRIQRWQQYFRMLMTHAFTEKYQVHDFILTDTKRCCYILKQTPS